MKAAAALASAATVLGVWGAPAMASQPAIHFSEDVTGDTFACETTTYTVTSGMIRTVIHEGASRSGNTNFTGTITLQNVVAEDTSGDVFSIRGAVWFGGTTNAQQGSEQFSSTNKLQIIAQGGGKADSVNLTFHVNVVNGQATNVKEFDFGSCEEPQ